MGAVPALALPQFMRRVSVMNTSCRSWPQSPHCSCILWVQVKDQRDLSSVDHRGLNYQKLLGGRRSAIRCGGQGQPASASSRRFIAVCVVMLG